KEDRHVVLQDKLLCRRQRASGRRLIIGGDELQLLTVHPAGGVDGVEGHLYARLRIRVGRRGNPCEWGHQTNGQSSVRELASARRAGGARSTRRTTTTRRQD